MVVTLLYSVLMRRAMAGLASTAFCGAGGRRAQHGACLRLPIAVAARGGASRFSRVDAH